MHARYVGLEINCGECTLPYHHFISGQLITRNPSTCVARSIINVNTPNVGAVLIVSRYLPFIFIADNVLLKGKLLIQYAATCICPRRTVVTLK